ncbi:S-adenosyl-L-methionine-dependent methyltransferase [Gautieria morchelliformis]|nr:S-adenosyl-L-methionine-dependent methyltransferase [Gautieria morchelliformis]
MGDPYGTYHIGLNNRSRDDTTMQPETEWLNMGYWKDTQCFPDACEALALKVIERAQCVDGGHVLDVGHACGDSLLIHLCHPEVPRPTTLTGITSLPSQHARSMARVAKQQSFALAQPCEVRLFCGDAVFRRTYTDHPLNPLASTPLFTSIIALDCAYHFASRDAFLRQSLRRLAPGGSIALADLAISKPLPFVLRTVLSKLLSVHSENMITPEIYMDRLKAIGYANVRVEDISHDVFPGFQVFLRSRGGFWRIMGLMIGAWATAGGGS